MISTRTEKRLPRVAIVGRPNVGKSTLFNRFLGKRRSITDAVPGVTRDPVEAECVLGGRKISLVDTGGFRLEGEGIDELVTRKSLDIIENSDLIILLLDVTEITPEDESFISHLRKHSDKLLLVVNKVDNPSREYMVWNYNSLGLGEAFAVSATHGSNIDELKDKILSLLNFDTGEEERSTQQDVVLAVLGKPNTGKSTLSNLLSRSDHSIVSDVPGTTRDVIEGYFGYKNHIVKLLDTAGIRRKSKVSEDIEYYSVNRAIKTIDEADVVLLLVDVEEGITEQDKKIASLVVKRGRGIILVLNKWDRMQQIGNSFEAVKDRVKFLFPVLDFAPIIPISALKNEGVDNLLDTVLMVHRELNRRVDTGKLNKMLQQWVKEYAPPMVQGKRFKVRYGTQVGTNPVKFILFVNRLKGFPRGYVQYLTNRIRKFLGFHHIPLDVELRESARGDAPFLDK